MQASDNPPRRLRQPRPLPSVKLALLPHERRAARARQTLVVVSLILLAAGVAGSLLVRGELPADEGDTTHRSASLALQDTPQRAPVVARVATAENQPAAALELGAPAARDRDESVREVRGTFGRARSFREAVKKLGATTKEATEITAALRGLVDFRRCHPDHEMVLVRDQDRQLVSFEYHAQPVSFVRASRDANGELVGKQVQVPIRRVRVARGSYVAGSLGSTLEALGLGRSLAGAFVEVFEGRIDFSRDTRAGDCFRLIVNEEHVNDSFLRYGTVEALEYIGERVSRLQAFWYGPGAPNGDFFDADGRSMHGGWLRTPLRYDHISSGFDPRRRHPILKRIVPHNGVDYAAAPGTVVWAAGDGSVTFAGRSGANGNLVVVRHDKSHQTFYAHLATIRRGLRRGVRVRQREPIGTVGSTGRSTGPHLHFGLKRRGRFVDPLKHLNGPGRMMNASKLPDYRRHVQRLRAELARIPVAAAPRERSAFKRAYTRRPLD